MGPAEISATLSSLKSAYDIAKAMLDLREATAFQSKVFELQREILSAQQNCIVLVSTVARSKKKWHASKRGTPRSNFTNSPIPGVARLLFD